MRLTFGDPGITLAAAIQLMTTFPELRRYPFNVYVRFWRFVSQIEERAFVWTKSQCIG
jgi:hypothetical protein